MTTSPDEGPVGPMLTHFFPTPEHREDFFATLDASLRQEPARRAPRLTLLRGGIGTVAVGGAIAIAVGTMDLGQVAQRPDPTVPSPTAAPTTELSFTLASQLGEATQNKIASIGSIAGTVRTTKDGKTTAAQFRWSSTGDAWSKETTADGSVRTLGYRASTDTLEESTATEYYRTINKNSQTSSALPRDIATLQASVLALVNSNEAVQTVNYEGQPAWQATVPTVVDGIGDDHNATTARVTVSRATTLPVAVSYFDEKNRPVREVTLADVVVNPSFTANDFSVPVPAGVQPTVERGSYQTTDGGLQSSAMPTDFERAESRRSTAPVQEGFNDPSTDVTTTTYRRGLQSVTLTQRTNATKDYGGGRDPFFNFEFQGTTKAVAITRGPFAGQTATVVQDAIGSHYLWVAKGSTVATVGGDLSDDELVAIANTLADD